MNRRRLRGIQGALVALVGLLLSAGGRPAYAAELLPPDVQRPAVKCQADIMRAGVTFVAKKLKLLDRCATAAFECVHRKPGDPVCLDRAATRCAKSLAKIAGEETKLATRIVDRCDGVALDVLVETFGLGYGEVAAECAADYGTPLTDPAAVAACVVLQHECLAERLFDTHEPRAAELLALAGVDLGPTACLEDRGGLGETVADASLVKALGKCQGALRKASSGFVTRKLKGVGKCLQQLFDCVQLDGGDAGCIAQAQGRCDKVFAKTEQQVLKLGAAVGKGCKALPIAALTAPEGLGADGLLPLCATLGVFGIGSANDYGNCVVRQHECAVDEIARFAVPRAAELLGEVGRTLPGGFFCPTPIPTATPVATPTPMPTATA
jgi:hypothetical protein